MAKRRSSSSQLNSASKRTKAVRDLIAQGVIFSMLAAAVVFFVVTQFTGGSVIIPSTAKGVLESVQSDDHYSWTSESVRRDIPGLAPNQEQQALRAATVDLRAKRFQASVAGVLPEPTIFVGTPDFTRALTRSAQESGAPAVLVNQACGGQKGVSASTLAYPSADEIIASNPQIVSDEQTMLGQQAWQISFDPSPRLIKQLLWIEFFNQTNRNLPNLQQWVLSDRERAALDAGQYKADWAYVWVSRDQSRSMLQIDVRFRFTIENGSAWRLLALKYPQEDNYRPLTKLNPGRVTCTGDQPEVQGGDPIEQQPTAPSGQSPDGGIQQTP